MRGSLSQAGSASSRSVASSAAPTGRARPLSQAAAAECLEPELIAGRYRVERVLGEGGMASVLQVNDESTGRSLALKRLHREAGARHVALFEREYHTLSGLRHPHVVEVFEYGSDHGWPFYTMELLDGADVCGLGPLPFAQVCSILRDVSSALSLLHARRLVHRDVSARNVWRTKSGWVKLIDFGTLSPFGTASDVAGTPPFIPPEALHGEALDSRSDLYALGALGYSLLTGSHAFPAHEVGELEELWRRRPSSPRERVSALARADLPEIPVELDALIEGLLSRDAMARPSSSAEVIGRLCAVAGLPSDSQASLIEGHLASQSFVARTDEKKQLARALARLDASKGKSFLIEAEAGMGRTRLLSELALEARIAAATVVHSDAALTHGILSCAEELALKLLGAAPELAREVAKPHAATLGHLSNRLRDRLGLSHEQLVPMPPTGGEARLRIQAALGDLFKDFAARHNLVLLIDNAHALDEASSALLTGLAHASADRRLLLVSTLLLRDDVEESRAIKALRQQASVLKLAPLAAKDMEALLRSVFSDAPHLSRLSGMLHERSQGRPGRCMELADHLVRERVVRHVDGVWLLPQSIPDHHLPSTHSAVQLARLERLSRDARALARSLSVHDGRLPLELCTTLSDLPTAQLFSALEALVTERVLVGSSGGYRFRETAVQKALFAELAPLEKQRAHRALGEHLLNASHDTPLGQLQAGVHLLLGGSERRGEVAVAHAGKRLVTSDHGSTGLATAALERALAHFKEKKRSKHELVAVLTPLALAGYYHDRRFAARYGDETLRVLSSVLGLSLARRLRPLLGAKLSLYVGLGFAWLGFRMRAKNPRVPSFGECMLLLVSCVAALTGVSTICVDPRTARRTARVLEPLTALGEDHAGTVMYEFCSNLATTVEDRHGEAQKRWQRLIARLSSGTVIRNLPDHAKVFYYAGALYACGVLESWRDSSEALQYANKVESLGLKLYELGADQIRMLYYAHQGDTERLEYYRERVEMHAIQRGSAWQVETWASGAMITVALRTHDALRLKHALEQLKQASHDTRSLELLAQRAEGAYLLLRGKPEAKTLLLDVLREEPLAVVGWARAHGALARACNLAGEHTLAREVCFRALDHMSSDDLTFSAMNLSVEIELALAEAGLGKHAVAVRLLDQLIEAHRAGEGPLTLGALHEARARVALLAGEDDEFRRHAAQMDRYFRGTAIPSLVERGERLMREGRRSVGFLAHESSGKRTRPRDEQAFAQRLRSGGGDTISTRAPFMLGELAGFAGVREAYLFMANSEGPECVASVGPGQDARELQGWVSELLEAAQHRDNVTANSDLASTREDPTRIIWNRSPYRLTVLRSASNDAWVVGALVCPDDLAEPLPERVLTAMAERLHEVATAAARA